MGVINYSGHDVSLRIRILTSPILLSCDGPRVAGDHGIHGHGKPDSIATDRLPADGGGHPTGLVREAYSRRSDRTPRRARCAGALPGRRVLVDVYVLHPGAA